MKFNDIGIIISLRKYSENSLIIKVFSQNHGVCRGFIKSAKSAKFRAIYQIGNLISFELRSRIEENLGSFFLVDLERSYCAKIIFDALKLDCVSSLFSIIDKLFLERQSHFELFEKVQVFLQEICIEDCPSNVFIAEYIKLELHILRELGYGVDLSSCVATNSKLNLAFVSPKSARAVSFEAGKPYQNKLLKLPTFLVQDDVKCDEGHLLEGLELSGFFLQKFLCEGWEISKMIHRENIKNHLKCLKKEH